MQYLIFESVTEVDGRRDVSRFFGKKKQSVGLCGLAKKIRRNEKNQVRSFSRRGFCGEMDANGSESPGRL